MPPSIVRLGKDIILDKQQEQISNVEESVDYIKEWLEPLGYNTSILLHMILNLRLKLVMEMDVYLLQKPGVLIDL